MARAQKRSVESGMSAEAFAGLLANKAEFDAALKRFTERKGEAEDAERRAGERGRGQDAREVELNAREQDLDARATALAKEVEAFKEWRSRFDNWLDDRAA